MPSNQRAARLHMRTDEMRRPVSGRDAVGSQVINGSVPVVPRSMWSAIGAHTGASRFQRPILRGHADYVVSVPFQNRLRQDQVEFGGRLAV
jgi:hypothetical protein